MLASRPLRLGTIAVVCLSAVALAARPALQARSVVPPAAIAVTSAAGSISDEAGAEAPGTVYISEPITGEMAATWAKLQMKVTMPFQNETPLQDVIRHIQDATAGPGGEPGFPVYVDPVGLTEADLTLSSPVTIDLQGVPLATSLSLALRQLGLDYHVQKDGIVYITSANQDDGPVDPSARILEELSALRREVAALRKELGVSQGGGMGGGQPTGRGAAGGGFR